MKTAAPENGVADSPAAKRSKLDTPAENEVDAPPNEHVDEIEKIQEELHALDELCAKEQMQIQKKFDEKKKPFFDKRQTLIDKIPHFWADALLNHPALNVLTVYDRPLLECLKRIELEDNLDDNGSYRIQFVFTDAIKEYFEPTTLVKYVRFDESKEEVAECTEIQWKEGKNPIEQIRPKGGEDDDDDEAPEFSIFEWFSKTVSDDKPDLGEVIRREIWHAPLSYFMGEQPYDDDLDEEAVEEEDEDDEEELGEEGLDDEEGDLDKEEEEE